MRKKLIALSTIIASLTPKVSLSLLLTLSLVTPSVATEKAKTVTIQGSPTVIDDEVKVRVKVEQEGNKPMVELKEKDFKVKVDNNAQKDFKWKSPQEAVSPPAWIVVLLDMSGSMTSKDASGTSKIHGAVQAIRQLVKASQSRGDNTHISIVPFGEKGTNCPGFEDYKELSGVDKFFLARDVKLQTYLDYLESQIPCASTNIYEPVAQAVRVLGNQTDSRFHIIDKDNTNIQQPRLSIILLSDGYQNTPNEGKDFAKLKKLLEENNRSPNPIIIHTLGYGLTPEKLGQKYKLGHKATRRDISAKKVPEDEYVDKERMGEIAKITGGISEFSADAEEVTQRLELFLNSLLGEYELSYTQPTAERGSKHTVKVSVQEKLSPPGNYTVTVFGRSLPLNTRLIMIGSTLFILGVGGIIPFIFWGKRLSAQMEND